MNQVHALLRSAYAYSRNIFGKGIGIAVLDTGVWAGHPDLFGKYCRFCGFCRSRKEPYDDHGHGTHVPGSLPEAGRRPEGCIWALRPCPG